MASRYEPRHEPRQPLHPRTRLQRQRQRTNLSTSLELAMSAAVVRSDPPTPVEDAEFVKPVNSGTNIWNTSVEYIWNASCILLDPLASYTQDTVRRDSFAWVSHTFTHENLDNATYSDTFSEISFNKEHANQLGFPNAKYFSAEGLIPPAIIGLYNGDALRAFYENGLRYVVGDNTRDALRNPTNYYWPLETTQKDYGFAGIQITPRWSTRIYWDRYIILYIPVDHGDVPRHMCLGNFKLFLGTF
jgi:hypothetical protein